MKGKATVIFSLEMSKYQLANRILSNITFMPTQKIVTRRMDLSDFNLLEKDGKILEEIPLFIDDTPGLTLLELGTKARRLKRDQNIELIVIDYLQLMSGGGKGQNREGEISEISRGLKRLAKELDIPIIALSQLSRKCEERPDKKPILSDLRESGAIEQDADMVIFTFRPEYYGIPEYFIGDNRYDAKDLMALIIAKFRQGQPGEVICKWDGERTSIGNYKINEYNEDKF